jgi:aspartokinase
MVAAMEINWQPATCAGKEKIEIGGLIRGKDLALINVLCLPVHGPHFRERPGLGALMFSTLAAAGIKLLAVSTSISTLSCVIEADRLEAAVQALHETFQIP